MTWATVRPPRPSSRERRAAATTSSAHTRSRRRARPAMGPRSTAASRRAACARRGRGRAPRRCRAMRRSGATRRKVEQGNGPQPLAGSRLRGGARRGVRAGVRWAPAPTAESHRGPRPAPRAARGDRRDRRSDRAGRGPGPVADVDGHLLDVLRPGHRGWLREVERMPCRGGERRRVHLRVALSTWVHHRHAIGAREPYELLPPVVRWQHASPRDAERSCHAGSRGMGRGRSPGQLMRQARRATGRRPICRTAQALRIAPRGVDRSVERGGRRGACFSSTAELACGVQLPLPMDQGGALATRAPIHDMTAEEKLRFADALLAAETENTPDGVLLADRDGRVVTYNRRFAEIWAAPPEALDRARVDDVFCLLLDSTREPAHRSMALPLFSPQTETQGAALELLDGRVVEVHSGAIRGAGGELFGRIWFFRDVTAQRRSEGALRASHALLATTERMAHIGGWRWEVEGDALAWSEEIYRIFGFDPRQPATVGA